MKLLSLTINGQEIAPPSSIPNPSHVTLSSVLQGFVTLIFIVISLLALVYLIWAGIKYIMAEGDKAKVTAARNQITYSLFGLILTLLSFAIVSFFGYIFGVPLI